VTRIGKKKETVSTATSKTKIVNQFPQLQTSLSTVNYRFLSKKIPQPKPGENSLGGLFVLVGGAAVTRGL
jgi:hypothetical protein